MEDIVRRLEEWNKAYRSGNPLVPDLVYDSLLEELPENHYYRTKIEPEIIYKNRIKHSKPMLSMQKAKTEKEISKWIDSILKVINQIGIPSKNIMIRCTAKLDGIAGKYKEFKLITRGDGLYGNDVTNALDKGIFCIGAINTTSTEIITQNQVLGEFVVKLDYFNENLSHKFSHPRNFVSGAIMSDTVNSLTDKAFQEKAVIFQAYIDLPNKVIPILDLLNNFREAESFISNSVNYKIDGVIFEVVNEELKAYLGETDHHPNWAIALKPKDKTYTSEVISIEWNPGRTGKITPIIIMEPVTIDGVIVRRATGHNAKIIIEMGIKPGVTIELIRSGSVIPYIVKVIEDDNSS